MSELVPNEKVVNDLKTEREEVHRNQDILDRLEDVVSSLDARVLSWEEYDKAVALLTCLDSQLKSSVMMNEPRNN